MNRASSLWILLRTTGHTHLRMQHPREESVPLWDAHVTESRSGVSTAISIEPQSSKMVLRQPPFSEELSPPMTSSPAQSEDVQWFDDYGTEREVIDESLNRSAEEEVSGFWALICCSGVMKKVVNLLIG